MTARGTEQGTKTGFVLIEILVALSLLALIGAMSAGFLGQLRAVSELGQGVSQLAELEAAAQHLKRTFAGVRTANLVDEEADEGYLFRAGPERVHFAAATRRGFFALALREITLVVEVQNGRKRLVEVISTRRSQEREELSRITVLEDFDAAIFEFANAEGGFADEWDDPETLPAAIRVTLTRSVGKKTYRASATARIL